MVSMVGQQHNQGGQKDPGMLFVTARAWSQGAAGASTEPESGEEVNVEPGSIAGPVTACRNTAHQKRIPLSKIVTRSLPVKLSAELEQIPPVSSTPTKGQDSNFLLFLIPGNSCWKLEKEIAISSWVSFLGY
ncbi:hypothetical protein Y1Q_0023398 [Alligator mississippiensis]|uniref:Uncharacterized protein n=1 Tax=Alligator mississippiensis TaxID=8496 RepID=A0A151NPJ2_ALLMI|nr:hypothetical protein Y1Q_0023398 [Alligator mississippiensis]